MDGGRNSFSIDIDVTTGANGNITLTTERHVDTNVTPEVDETTRAWTMELTGPTEPLQFIGFTSGGFQVEMCAADIRYGSMVVREVRPLGQNHATAPSNSILPWSGAPIGAPITKNPLPGGPLAGQVPADAAFFLITSETSAPADWFVGTKFKIIYHIEAENTSETREVEDDLYAPDIFGVGGQATMELFGTGVTLMSTLEKDSIFSAGNGTVPFSSGPTIVNDGPRIGQFIGQQAQAVHDRFGDYFWTVAADEDQDMLMFYGAGFSYSPDAANIGDADYEFQDPVVVTGIPGDNPRFDPVSLL
jgi:hypothetical protein